MTSLFTLSSDIGTEIDLHQNLRGLHPLDGPGRDDLYGRVKEGTKVVL